LGSALAKRQRLIGDLDDRWTLHAADRTLPGNKSGATRLGFAVLFKLFQADGRFPRRPEDVPVAAVKALASQVGVPAAMWRGYDWHGRAIRYHRVQIRTALGFGKATNDDAAALAHWLVGQVLALERRHDRLVAAARERRRALRLEPPSPERLERLVRSALHRQEEAFCAAVLTRLLPETAAGLDVLLKASTPAPVMRSAAKPIASHCYSHCAPAPVRPACKASMRKRPSCGPSARWTCPRTCSMACPRACRSPTAAASRLRSCTSCAGIPPRSA